MGSERIRSRGGLTRLGCAHLVQNQLHIGDQGQFGKDLRSLGLAAGQKLSVNIPAMGVVAVVEL